MMYVRLSVNLDLDKNAAGVFGQKLACALEMLQAFQLLACKHIF